MSKCCPTTRTSSPLSQLHQAHHETVTATWASRRNWTFGLYTGGVSEPSPLAPSSADSLTPNEAAALLGVNGRTVRRWIKLRLLPVRTTFGGHYRLDRATIERLAASQYRDAQPLKSPQEGRPAPTS